MWYHSGIFIIHCHKYSKAIYKFINCSCYHIILFVGSLSGQNIVYFHSCTKAIAFIKIKGDQNTIPFFYLCSLLFIGKEEIFHQTPVKENSYVINFFNL